MDKVDIDTDAGLETTVSVVDGDPVGEIEAMSKDNGVVEGMSSSKEMIRKVGNTLTRLELDLAYTSEKLVNMNLLMMHLEAKECDFETFASEKEGALGDSAMKAFEFDILSGIFDSEVREMDRFIGLLQREVNNACQMIYSHKHLGDVFSALGEKLHDAEESMKQSQEQVSELMTQSIKFQRILRSFSIAETCKCSFLSECMLVKHQLYSSGSVELMPCDILLVRHYFVENIWKLQSPTVKSFSIV